jgi:hypothetical protein
MKRWQVVAEVAGFLVVMWSVVKRFAQVPAPSFNLREDSNPNNPVAFGVGCAVVVAIFAMLWGEDGRWRNMWRKAAGNVPAVQPYPSVWRWRHVAELAVLSVILGFTWGGAQGRGPGPLAAIRMNEFLDRFGFKPNFGVTLALIFCGNAVVCFALLMGAYLLWTRLRRKDKHSN